MADTPGSAKIESKVPPPADMLKGSDLSTPEKILSMMKDYAAGALRGATVDLAGTPVDIMNLLISPATKALGIYSEDPIGGSKHLRKVTGQPTEDKPTETAGGLLTPGGAAQAMILSAARLGKNVDEAVKIRDRVRTGMLESGKTIREAEAAGNALAFKKEGVYWDPSDRMKMSPKTVVSDAMATLNQSALKDLPPGGNVYLPGRNVTVENLIPGHTSLFSAHKDMAEVQVLPDNVGNIGNAVYNPRADTISIAGQRHPEGFKGTLLHEIQHAVQARDQALYRGSNPTAERTFTDNALQRLVQKQEELSMRKEWSEMSGQQFTEQPQYDALQRYISKAKLDESRAYTQYMNNPGEQEARFTQQNMSLSQEDLSNKVLDLLRQGKSPQSWDTRSLPDAQ